MKILTLCGEDENPLAAGDGLSIQVSAIDDVFDRCFPHRTIKKVLFLAPPDVDATMLNFATGRRGRYLNYPPYCFGVLASHLRTMGIDVRVVTLQTSVLCACQTAESEQAFDFDTSWKESVQNALMDCKPDFVGVTCMFSQTHQSFVNVCRKVREVAPGIPIAVGGVHVTNSLANGATRRKLLDDLQVVDFFFKYESDLSLRVFIKVIRGEQAFDSLMQVTVRVPHGFLDFGERNDPPKGEDINRIPAHDLLDPVGMSRWGKVGAFHCFKPKGTKRS